MRKMRYEDFFNEKIVHKDELFLQKEMFYNLIVNENSVFIHPTDTIYGLGANALSSVAVRKIREIKKSD